MFVLLSLKDFGLLIGGLPTTYDASKGQEDLEVVTSNLGLKGFYFKLLVKFIKKGKIEVIGLKVIGSLLDNGRIGNYQN